MNRKHFGCKVEGCNGKHKGLGYCKRHYVQVKKKGEIVVGSYNVYDQNETVDYSGCTGIILKDRYGKVVGEAIIDSILSESVLRYKWHKTKDGYVARRNENGQGLFFLHWQILGKRKGMSIDHINGNPLDNRIGNLRVCTQQENTFNSKVSKNSTTKFPGVSLHKPTEKWRAYIFYNGKHSHIGLYENFQDACKARKSAEKKFFGEYSPHISRSIDCGTKILNSAQD